jgi:hypothetical protein
MDITNIREQFSFWNNNLTKKEKRYIHFNSMKNFAYHYDSLPNERIKSIVIEVINHYSNEVQNNNFQYTSAESYSLATNYMDKISFYYKDYLKFKTILPINLVIGIGSLGDILLLVSGFLKQVYYLPIITLILFSHYLVIKIFIAKSRRVYGIFY